MRGRSLRYFLAGLRSRFLLDEDVLVHAHNASGYGLMALLSGRRYIVTIYGSDVYNAAQRGRLYAFVVSRILRKADRLTCTTTAMRDYVTEHFGVDKDRVHVFSMGISRDFAYSASERNIVREVLGLKGSIVITSNRRMQPQYRIDLIVRAFAELLRRSDRYRLIIFEGDGSPSYSKVIAQLIIDLGISDFVIAVRGIRTPIQVRALLAASDIVVSIPESDQLSASVLEALACRALVLGAEIPAYRELLDRKLIHPAAVESPIALADSIADHVSLGMEERLSDFHISEWIDNAQSDRFVMEEVNRLYYAAGVV